MPLHLETLVAATPELSAMPAVTARLLAMLENPDAPVDELVGIIEKDPALTANVLKLSNSAYYGLRREVGSVREALIRLGNRNLVTLAFAASMGRLLQVPVTAYRLPRGRLWRHALAVGLLSSRLTAGAADPSERNRAFTAGVVHDLGKLLLDRPLGEALEPLPADLDSRSLCEAERQRLGCDHAEAGAALAENWNFPTDLVAVIAGHHDAVPVGGLVRMVALADLLVCGSGLDGGAPRVPEEVLAAALQNAGVLQEQAHADLQQALRDMDGLVTILGASS